MVLRELHELQLSAKFSTSENSSGLLLHDFIDRSGQVGIRQVEVPGSRIPRDVVRSGLQTCNPFDDSSFFHDRDIFSLAFPNVDGIVCGDRDSRRTPQTGKIGPFFDEPSILFENLNARVAHFFLTFQYEQATSGVQRDRMTPCEFPGRCSLNATNHLHFIKAVQTDPEPVRSRGPDASGRIAAECSGLLSYAVRQ